MEYLVFFIFQDAAFSNQPSLIIPPAKTHLNVITAIQPVGPRLDQDFEDPPPEYAIHVPPEPAYGGDDLYISYGSVAAPSTICGEEERKRGSVSGESGKDLYVRQAPFSCSQRSFYTRQHRHATAASAERSAPEQATLFHERGGVKEKKENELEALLSVYAAQNARFMSATHSKHSDLRLADDDGAMHLEEMEKDGGGHTEEEEQDPGTIFVDWELKLGKLVLPELAKWIDRGSEPGNGGEPTKGGGEEEGSAMGGGLLLEDVFVRQASEEEVQTPRELETDPGGEEEAQDILTKWDLVISLDD